MSCAETTGVQREPRCSLFVWAVFFPLGIKRDLFLLTGATCYCSSLSSGDDDFPPTGAGRKVAKTFVCQHEVAGPEGGNRRGRPVSKMLES